MTEFGLPEERVKLLANIAEMYFREGKNQSEIAAVVGMTRSNVSRLLKEARESGVVQIHINHPINENQTLAQQLIERFNLIDAKIIDVTQFDELLPKLGRAAGKELIKYLRPGCVLGTAWGTAISATVDQVEMKIPIPGIKVVQLLGAQGAHIKEYDGHAIVRRLEEKFGAEGIYFHAPFFVEDSRMSELIMQSKSIEEIVEMAEEADVALLGVGSIDIDHSSYYLAGYISKEEILAIQEEGVVGDVCAKFFDSGGNLVNHDLKDRMIGIPAKVLMKIPVRLGVAGGLAKVEPIIGALKGNFINILVSDTATAVEVLKRTQN
ncbi:MAG: sugar-binding transcriptional regulator [Brevefilum sp.]|nr:sugar-binding transcriptional regulator [Brevefilum sp.]